MELLKMILFIVWGLEQCLFHYYFFFCLVVSLDQFTVCIQRVDFAVLVSLWALQPWGFALGWEKWNQKWSSPVAVHLPLGCALWEAFYSPHSEEWLSYCVLSITLSQSDNLTSPINNTFLCAELPISSCSKSVSNTKYTTVKVNYNLFYFLLFNVD